MTWSSWSSDILTSIQCSRIWTACNRVHMIWSFFQSTAAESCKCLNWTAIGNAKKSPSAQTGYGDYGLLCMCLCAHASTHECADEDTFVFHNFWNLKCSAQGLREHGHSNDDNTIEGHLKCSRYSCAFFSPFFICGSTSQVSNKTLKPSVYILHFQRHCVILPFHWFYFKMKWKKMK
jgi:hypothetical protein